MSTTRKVPDAALSLKKREKTPGVQKVEDDTRDYHYDDFVVELLVGNEIFTVSSSRLAQHSPIFADMFTLPQPEEYQPITLHNNVGEFRDFLWYIHADPFSAKDFFEAPPSADKCLRLLGIANVAHMYSAETPARRAQDLALAILTAPKRPFTLDTSVARRIMRVAAREAGTVRLRFIDVICDAMYPRQETYPTVNGSGGQFAADPIAVVELAHEAEDLDLLAHAYFYVLLKGDRYWQSDQRLTATDRRRLLCGSHALRLYGAHTGARADGRPCKWKGWSEANVHPDIRPFRTTLWDSFDDGRWSLTDPKNTARPSDWVADQTRARRHTVSAAQNTASRKAPELGSMFPSTFWARLPVPVQSS